ncbi:MAG: thioesterase family protein [Jaaginema sp. PMC 1079.18]|nr:thioesterase family protein [Jaaginema sp. PMC 1080.18]MEC4851544.1 thioesterase family protein [Jaaginema sp. PMC 1079.18]MEC4868728.1 thioesterase family protein [Jaaginema sp. PMC 1078.18]
MSESNPPLLPTNAIAEKETLNATTERWFEYPVRAHPHHTDYAGIVWHGSYITWMEEARVECLRSIGIDFEEWVQLGCDLPVVELSVRYHQALRLGMTAIVKTRMLEATGVRIHWDYQIQSPDGKELYLTARVTLVAVDREKGKILRKLPPTVEAALVKLTQ